MFIDYFKVKAFILAIFMAIFPFFTCASSIVCAADFKENDTCNVVTSENEFNEEEGQENEIDFEAECRKEVTKFGIRVFLLSAITTLSLCRGIDDWDSEYKSGIFKEILYLFIGKENKRTEGILRLILWCLSATDYIFHEYN